MRRALEKPQVKTCTSRARHRLFCHALSGQEQPLDIGVQVADNHPGSPRAQSRRLLDVNNHGRTLLKSTLILVALSGLLGVPVAHAQSSTTFIGLREVYWRYVADPSGEAVFRPMGHCRGIGLRGVEDINPFLYPFFMPKSGSISSADRRFGAMATMYMQQGSNGLVRAAFSTVPRPRCEKNEFWSIS
jgi:hypothetical protein